VCQFTKQGPNKRGTRAPARDVSVSAGLADGVQAREQGRVVQHALLTGHTECSFCGRPFIVIAVAVPDYAVDYFAEFAVKESPTKTNAAQFTLEGHRGAKLAHGVVVFNQACTAWKYAWKSSRHTFDTLHVMRVYAFAPATGDVLFARDSSPFTVSSTKAPGNERPQSDLLAVFTAMGRLVPSAARSLPPFATDFDPCVDDDDDAVTMSDDVMADDHEDCFLTLSSAEEARFLAHEQLRAVLERLYAYMTLQYATWRSAAAMHADVDFYLRANEASSVEQLAALARDAGVSEPVLVHLRDDEELPCKQRALEFGYAEAEAWARSLLDADECLVDVFEPGGRNDPSGLYERSLDFSKIIGTHIADAGWSPVDQDLFARQHTSCIAVLSPTQIFLAFLGPTCWSDILTVGVANVPNDKRPTMFGATAASRIAYAFPTNRGVIQVASTLGAIFMGKVVSGAEGQEVRSRLVSTAAPGEPLMDMAKVSRRTTLCSV